jgi:glucokinase
MSKHMAIGVDIGGTKMALATVNANGEIGHRIQLPTQADLGFERAVQRLAEAVEILLHRSQSSLDALVAIGVGCAGPVDPIEGLINNPYTLGGWDRCDIVSPLRELFGRPVFLENDADAAALGEHWVGAGRDQDPIVMLTFGTGVGGGVILGGEIYRGIAGEHPELGHLSVDPNGAKCYCGTHGCLESIASGTAIGEAGARIGIGDARAVFAAEGAGRCEAQEIVSRAVAATASAAWTVAHTFLPQSLVLGGGLMEEHFDLFIGPIRSLLEGATQFTPSNLRIVKAVLGNDAGIIGAARLAWKAGA